MLAEALKAQLRACPSEAAAGHLQVREVPVNTANLETVYQGGYLGPLPLNTYPGSLAGEPMGTPDPWGYSSRYCGSYAAWMTTSLNRQMPLFSQIGLPGTWPQTVDPACIVTDPAPGDLAVVPSCDGDPKGHVLYLVAVGLYGTANLLATSYNSDEQGDFAMAIWAPSGQVGNDSFSLVYIRFPVIMPSA